jgi:hypothetical protein
MTFAAVPVQDVTIPIFVAFLPAARVADAVNFQLV